MEIPVFYSYAHEDEEHRVELEKHLELLRRQKIIVGWSDRKIAPGSNWEEEINFNIQNAKIIILLVSSDFLASDYCYETETIFALEQHEKGEAVVLPIIVRPCYWEISEFKHLQVLPEGAKPVIEWNPIDSAWLSVTKEIHKLAQQEQLHQEKQEVTIPSLSNLHDKLLAVGKQKLPAAPHKDQNPLNPDDEKSPIDFGTHDKLLEIEKIGLDKIISRGDKDLTKQLSLREFIALFFREYYQWYFSPLRIKKWGGKQRGFEKLKSFSSSEIKAELLKMEEDGLVKSTISKRGNPIYKLK